MSQDTRELQQDAQWMEQALELAQATIGLASPNPYVGCVVVRDGAVVGRGAHEYDQRDHAEVVALREAGERARGATVYVTLEPCAHHGRTPPCAEALIAARVGRVVIATGDPNPQVNGQGVARLRAQGIAVSVGALRDEAQALNDGFARWITTGLPCVTMKAALSLDGRIAPAPAARTPGTVTYLSGTQALRAVHEMRHAMDAIVTGIGTVLADDPLLTDRSGRVRRRRLLRVVLDPALRLPLASRLVQSAEGDLLVLTGPITDERRQQREQALAAAGVLVETVDAARDGRLDLRAAFHHLGRVHAVLNAMVEGGSRLNRSLLEPVAGAPLVDRLCLFYAPVFLGEQGVPLLAGELPPQPGLPRLVMSPVDHGFRVEARLRDPWSVATGVSSVSVGPGVA